MTTSASSRWYQAIAASLLAVACGELPSEALDAIMPDTADAVADSTDEGTTDVEPTADAPDGATCTTGEQRCVRGVLAQCQQDSWAISACPRGEICIDAACTPSIAFVQIVVGSPVDSASSKAALPDAAFAAAAILDWETTSTECAQKMEEASGDHDMAPTAAALSAKYWVRRLLGDMHGVPMLLQLVGPPSVTAGTGDAGCGLSTGPQPDECIGPGASLLSHSRFAELIHEAFPAGSLENGTLRLGPSDDTRDWTAIERLTETFVKVEPTLESASLLDWVDGSGVGGDGSSVELELHATGAPIPAPLLSFLALATRGSPEGQPCGQDGDCRHPWFTCSSGKCHDSAAPCRQRQVVWIAPFQESTSPPIAECQPTIGAVDSDLWAQWSRWGCECNEDLACLEGARCRSECLYTTNRGCEAAPVCFPENVYKLYTPTPPYGKIGSLSNHISTGGCDVFPSRYPSDVGGGLLVARTSAISTQENSILAGPWTAQEYATAAAVMGDGVAITPCGIAPDDDINPMELSPLVSCDFELKYTLLTNRLSQLAGTALCTPDMVGLSSQVSELPED